MKKTKKQLELKKSTIRVLGTELSAVQGGRVPTSLCQSVVTCDAH